MENSIYLQLASFLKVIKDVAVSLVYKETMLFHGFIKHLLFIHVIKRSYKYRQWRIVGIIDLS